MNKLQINVFAWGVSTTAVVVAVVAWGQSYDWELSELNPYQIFPLFGLLAFSLMWAHYVSSVVRRFFKLEKSDLSAYFESTSLLVLAFILAHPGLLAWLRWRDGFGLPPGSELNYRGPLLKSSIILGMISLFIFLAYELRRLFSERRWWRFVEYATDIAILMVYIHASRLGSQLQTGWFKGVWIFYGVTLLASLGYIYFERIKKPQALS